MKMIIAIPTVGGQLCPHFGHCDRFALVRVDEAGRQIHEVRYETPPPHEPGVLPGWLHQLGAGLVIAGGMGQRALSRFADYGIEVVVGASVGTPEQLVADYLNRKLATGSNVCDH